MELLQLTSVSFQTQQTKHISSYSIFGWTNHSISKFIYVTQKFQGKITLEYVRNKWWWLIQLTSIFFSLPQLTAHNAPCSICLCEVKLEFRLREPILYSTCKIISIALDGNRMILHLNCICTECLKAHSECVFVALVLGLWRQSDQH